VRQLIELKIVIPTFDGRLSKNERLKRGRYGDTSIGKLKDSFVTFIRSYARALIECDMLEVELIVYRPDKRYDGQNFIDEFCDIVQEALNINDRHFKSTKITTIDGELPHFELVLRGIPKE